MKIPIPMHTSIANVARTTTTTTKVSKKEKGGEEKKRKKKKKNLLGIIYSNVQLAIEIA